MVLRYPKISSSRSIGTQVIRDHQLRDKAILLEEFAHQFQRRMLIPFRLYQHVEDLAFGIDGPPQVDHAAINLEIDLVQVPGRVGLWSALAQVCGDHGAKMVHPPANCLVRDRDTSLRQQIFDVAEAQGKPEI